MCSYRHSKLVFSSLLANIVETIAIATLQIGSSFYRRCAQCKCLWICGINTYPRKCVRKHGDFSVFFLFRNWSSQPNNRFGLKDKLNQENKMTTLLSWTDFFVLFSIALAYLLFVCVTPTFGSYFKIFIAEGTH